MIRTPQDLAEKLVGAQIPTAEQAAVIAAGLRPVRVVAGAGSGKTETLSMRVAYQVAIGQVAPERVIGLTFTRKAARELSHRMRGHLNQLRDQGLIPELPTAADSSAAHDPADVEHPLVAAQPLVATYDSFAGKLYGDYALLAGYDPDDTFLTMAGSYRLAYNVAAAAPQAPASATSIATVARDMVAFDEQLRAMAAEDVTLRTVERDLTERINRFQELLAIPDGRKKKAPPAERALASMIYRLELLPLVRAFQEEKQRRGVLTFADQTARALDIVTTVKPARRAIAERYDLIILDEYQDTSATQTRMLSKLFQDRGVTAVGDPNQAIYSWRGAAADTLGDFAEQFSSSDDVESLTLSIAWRNRPGVLRAANRAAQDLRMAATGTLTVPELSTLRADASGNVQAYLAPNTEEEAAAVVSFLNRTWVAAMRRWEEGQPVPSAAVLTRLARHMDPIGEALQHAGIPFAFGSANMLVGRPEARDLRAALRAAIDPSSGTAIMRLLTGGRIGIADLSALFNFARANTDRNLVEALELLRQGAPIAGLTPTARHRCTQIAASLHHIRTHRHLALPDLVSLAGRALNLDVELAARGGTSPLAGLSALADLAAQFDAAEERASIPAFLEWLDDGEEHERGFADVQAEQAQGVVNLLTVHSAKGLEFDYVAVPGLNDGEFPHFRSGKLSAKDRKPLHIEATDLPGGEPGWLDGSWLISRNHLPGPLSGDCDNQPELNLGDATNVRGLERAVRMFQLDAGHQHLLEERRLAYVAFTRARYEVFLSAAKATEGRVLERDPSPFLTELLGGPPPTTAPQDDAAPAEADAPYATQLESLEQFEAGGTKTTTWPTASLRAEQIEAAAAHIRAGLEHPPSTADDVESMTDSPAPPQSDAADHLNRSVALVVREHHEDTTPRVNVNRLAATSLTRAITDPEATRLDLLRPIPRPYFDAAAIGTQVHDRIERYYATPAIVSDEELARAAGVEEVGEPAATQRRSDRAFENFERSSWATRSPIAIEAELRVAVDGDEIPTKIDAVFEDATDDGERGVLIVDWKTGRPPAPEVADQVAMQVQIYRLAWAQRYGIDIAKVRGCLVYLNATDDGGQPFELHAPMLNAEEIIESLRSAKAALGEAGDRQA